MTLGEGRIVGTYKPLPLAVDGAGRAVTAWLQSPTLGPDGVATETCLHAVVAGDGAVDDRAVRCVPGVTFGESRAASDEAGNLLVGWQLGRFAPSLRAEIHLAGRPAGGIAWNVPNPVFGDDRGFLELHAIQPTDDDRFLVPVTQGQAVLRRDEGFVHVVTVDTLGTPSRLVLGRPRMPGRRLQTDLPFLPFAGEPGGVLTWVSRRGDRLTTRATILMA